MDKTRRNFLSGLGVAASGVASLAVSAAPRIEEEVIKKVRVEHELVIEKQFLTHGDGTKDGDRAMVKVGDHYRSCVLKYGSWRLMFPN